MVQDATNMQQNESSATGIKLVPGMVFAVNSGSALAACINGVQKAKATDNESTYNHAGIITATDGSTFEALWKIRHGSLNAYAGKKIIIAMHKYMSKSKFDQAWQEIAKLDGKIYPVPRLFLHAVGLAKFIHWKYPVCSELVAKFEFEAGLRTNWWGINPDNLADEWRISKYYDVVYEGEWKC